MDVYQELANVVTAIKSDPPLKRAFITVLQVGSYTQQVRVQKLTEEVSKRHPPPEVLRFLTLLKDDKIANLVYSELIK